jgi:hypothetical protein
MTELQPAFDPFFQVAYALLVLSYLAWNELTLRVILLFANILFVLEGFIIVNVAVDIVVWAGAIVIVTIFYIVLILYRCRPIYFSSEFEALYLNVFSDVLLRHEFHLLIKKKIIRFKEIRSVRTQIVMAGNSFDFLYILGDCKSTKVALASGQNVDGTNLLLESMESYAWIGTVEYIQEEETLTAQLYKVSVYVAAITTPFTYYTIDLARLKRQMKSKRYGMSIQNAFLSKMLGYLATHLRFIDREYIRALSAVKSLSIARP